MNKDIGIYIHIPFCKSRCYYCDFCSYSNKEDVIDKYIDAICKELLQNAEVFSQYNISTVYFGGGTPSYIDSKYIIKIMDIIKLFATDLKEVTIEINPGTVNIDKLKDYKLCGINRLSIGLQSTHNDVLKSIGRIHTFEDFIKTLDMANTCDFNNISLDLIYPLPNIDLSRFKESVDTVISLKDHYSIKHISIYNLELHENTKLDFLIKEGFLSLVDEEEEYEMKKYLESKLEENGFDRYEISNFALNGYQSKHNLNYWNQGEYIGIGVSAASFFTGSRYSNITNIDKYTQNVNNNNSIIAEKEDLDKLDLMKEYIILSLRLKDGINKIKFKKRFNTDIENVFKTEIEKLLKENLIQNDGEHIYLTYRGREVANIVWQNFI